MTRAEAQELAARFARRSFELADARDRLAWLGVRPGGVLALSRHAADVMGRRGVSWGDLLGVLTDPGLAYPTRDRTLYARGRIGVVVARPSRPGGAHTVVTVLLRSGRVWTDADVRAALGRLSPAEAAWQAGRLACPACLEALRPCACEGLGA